MKDLAHLHHQSSRIALRRLRCAVTACLSLAVVLTLGTAARAQFDIESKLTASDAAARDRFGWSVAISGNTAFVGAGASLNGDNTGSAYLFDVSTGNQLFRIAATDAVGEEGSSFGFAVGISGGAAIVGASHGQDAPGINSGSAYLFDVSTGNQLFKITASDADLHDHFGGSVDISGGTAIVGAERDSDAGEHSGSAYLFDVTTGTELFKLTASDAAEEDHFGFSVGISGEVAIVGAHEDDDPFTKSGSAYLFDVTTGKELFKLTAGSDAGTRDEFGWSVDISGNTAIVGAPFNDDAGTIAGTAYLFDVTTGRKLFKLTASDAATGDMFGDSVAISGNTAVVGATGDNDFSGSAYLFDVTTGKEIVKLTASDAMEGDYFGGSTAISGATAIVGVFGDSDAGLGSGSAYLFTSALLPSDLTNNGFVDFADLTILLANWNKPGATPAEGNLVNAGTTSVDFADLTALLAAWTGSAAAGAPEAALGNEAVPEPSALLLVVIAALGLSVGGWRRRRTGTSQAHSTTMNQARRAESQ